jgi:hypothetical protein
MDRYLKSALETLGIKINSNDKEKSIKQIRSEWELALSDLESAMIEAKEAIVIAKDNLDMIQKIEHQIKVERYKDLNKGLDVEVF